MFIRISFGTHKMVSLHIKIVFTCALYKIIILIITNFRKVDKTDKKIKEQNTTFLGPLHIAKQGQKLERYKFQNTGQHIHLFKYTSMI